MKNHHQKLVNKDDRRQLTGELQSFLIVLNLSRSIFLVFLFNEPPFDYFGRFVGGNTLGIPPPWSFGIWFFGLNHFLFCSVLKATIQGLRDLFYKSPSISSISPSSSSEPRTKIETACSSSTSISTDEPSFKSPLIFVRLS